MRPCRCISAVAEPQYRAHLGTGGICIFALGRTEEQAIRNLALHAKRDRIPRRSWVEAWIETMRGELVREVALTDLGSEAGVEEVK
jgi:hypothetical protein